MTGEYARAMWPEWYEAYMSHLQASLEADRLRRRQKIRNRWRNAVSLARKRRR